MKGSNAACKEDFGAGAKPNKKIGDKSVLSIDAPPLWVTPFMKFLSLADWTGIVESELFAKAHKTYGLATARYPVLEIEARVKPFENGRGFT